ncbi:ABC transporter permease [Corynebacterium massiliense]|uniref:ABC-2 family transporter protein n=1 Tax=Corynebacterium massiliense DSM 45435 TaxID=1121364 RepID=A0ABY7U7Q9_9CORY|nr:ABC transporter permease [Corynebacterium massiliense]WCZ32738.1 ABC-2 family transporter protein [Corynebacterium massiliense DSM 45435]
MHIFLSEARKLFSLRSTWIYLLITLGGMAAAPILDALLAADGLNRNMPLVGLTNAGALASLVIIFSSAMMVGNDHKAGTIAWSFLSTNNRGRIVASQAILITLAQLAAAVLGMLLGFLGSTAVGATWDMSTFGEAQFPQWLVMWSLYSLLAVGLAWILRSGTYAAIIMLIEDMIIETTAPALPGEAGRLVTQILPGANAVAVTGNESAAGIEHGPTVAALILLIYLAVALVGGWLIACRRAVR